MGVSQDCSNLNRHQPSAYRDANSAVSVAAVGSTIPLRGKGTSSSMIPARLLCSGERIKASPGDPAELT